LLLEQIGRGGMATVYKAADLAHAGKLVAVKVPLPQYSSGVGTWSMSQHEAEIGMQLDHPYILKFIDLPPEQHRNHIVTEYVSGTPLAERVGKGRVFVEPEAIGIMSRVSDAVAYLHAQGFVHYDLKPENVLLCDDGSIRLIDFGMAHLLSDQRSWFSAAAPPIASAAYVAPEQLRRVRGKRSVDIYALGAMFYELLTGQAPFAGDDPFIAVSARQIGDPAAPRVLNPAISPQAEEIALRALRRDPAARYLRVAEFKADLDHASAVQVSGLADRLVPVTTWRRRAFLLRYACLIGVLPVALLVAMFRILWWYLEHKR
jgi:serine/threonine-protein kinase